VRWAPLRHRGSVPLGEGWTTRGAHLLLQTRAKTLNRDLGMVVQYWYPNMQVEETADAA
jgi:hypothetical protein